MVQYGGLWFLVFGLRFTYLMWDQGFRSKGLGFRILGFKILGRAVLYSGFGVWGLGGSGEVYGS